MNYLKYLLVSLFLCSGLFAQNVVLIQMDDVGIDKVSSYGMNGCANTPNIDSLANGGVRFTNCYSMPVCSPTRATLLTGEYPFRHLIGRAIPLTQDFGLNPLNPNLLPKALPANYTKIALGKWHLHAPSVGGAWHPIFCGFNMFYGSLENIPQYGSYYNWQKTYTDNIQTFTFTNTKYATLDTADDLISAYSFASAQAQPFFIYCNFNAAHTPWEYPPGVTGPIELTGYKRSKAMIEYLDTQLGRFLSQIDWNTTTVILLSDNGSPPGTIGGGNYFRGVKGTVYEGGIKVPLFIKGKYVTSSGINDKLVNTTDIYSTVLSIVTQTNVNVYDSYSLQPMFSSNGTTQRTFCYSEYFNPNGTTTPTILNKMVRNDQYKIVSTMTTTGPIIEFFDLINDPFEMTPLNIGTLNPIENSAYINLMSIISTLGL